MKRITKTQNGAPDPAGYEHWKKKTAWFMSGQIVSLLGSSLTQFAIIWHITLSTSSGVMIMLSTLCSFLPQILISLFAGVWADRYNRKYLIMIADGMIALATLILAIIFMTGYDALWLLFVVSAIRSVGTGVQMPAVNALIPQLVPPEKLMRVNGMMGTLQSLIMLASPALSGAVLSTFGLEAAFFIDVGTAAIAIAIMFGLRVRKLERTAEENLLGAFEDLKLGLQYAWQHLFLRSFLGFYAVLMFLITPAAMLTPLMTTRTFGDELWKLTANEMAWSLGAAAGGLIVAVWGGFRNRIHSQVLGMVMVGIFTMGMGLSPSFLVYLVVLFVAGLWVPLINSSGMVLLQESVEMGMQGRVFSLMQIVSSSAIPLGMAIFGPLADAVPIEWLLVGTGAMIVLLGICMLKDKNLNWKPMKNGSDSMG